jgi:hypothetical protein
MFMKRLSSLSPIVVAALGVAIGASGCVNAFKGSNVQIDLSPGAAIQVPQGATPGAAQFAADTHYSVYAIQNTLDDTGAVTGAAMFQLTTFEVHPIVDLASPCYIDVGDDVVHPGLHVSQFAAVTLADNGITDIANPPAAATETQKIDAATALQRKQNVDALASNSGIRAITSASPGNYGLVAADCNGTDPTQIPPPSCTDDASNKLRLTLCKEAWSNHGTAGTEYFEGTDRILTAPLSGVTFGFVDGKNPINTSPVGGSQFFVPQVLDTPDAYAIYVEKDDATPSAPGTLVYYGKPTFLTQGVAHVHMTSTLFPSLTADMAIFSNLDQDNVHF